MAVIKLHTEECTANTITPELAAYAALWPNFCRDCRATGVVVRSGLELPCAACMNGTPYRCPRCRMMPKTPEFWTKGVDCVYCGWRGPADGAPLVDCDCPVRIEIERIAPSSKNQATAIRDKRSRLEAMAGISSAADPEASLAGKRTDDDRNKGNRRKQRPPPGLDDKKTDQAFEHSMREPEFE